MSITDDYPSVISYPTFGELSDVLSTKFEVLMSAMEYGAPTFVVRWPNGVVPGPEEQDRIFQDIHEMTKKLRVWPLVRWRNQSAGEVYIRFVPAQKAKKSDVKINYVLFIATLASIAIAGFMQATSPVFLTLFYPNGWTYFDIAFVTIGFMAALMGIIFTHEMGHFLTARNRGIEATLPYFIPGLPQLGGTFGAFIQQKSPPMNRRDLIDLGLAGPFAGFAVTLVVLVIGFLLSVPVTAEQVIALDEAFPGMSGELAVPLLFTFFEILYSDFIPAGGTIYMHPLAFVAWVGMLITALNLFPVSQLDGGHALRSIVGEKYHTYIGWGAMAVMFLMGYFMMAILILLMSRGGSHPGPLNDVVPVSKTRIAVFILAMLILVICIPPLYAML
ncbi:MAG: site-2 protease family protein [Candidatus Thorarchaeota archaeon]